jgi:hypothetical protein
MKKLSFLFFVSLLLTSHAHAMDTKEFDPAPSKTTSVVDLINKAASQGKKSFPQLLKECNNTPELRNNVWVILNQMKKRRNVLLTEDLHNGTNNQTIDINININIYLIENFLQCLKEDDIKVKILSTESKKLSFLAEELQNQPEAKHLIKNVLRSMNRKAEKRQNDSTLSEEEKTISNNQIQSLKQFLVIFKEVKKTSKSLNEVKNN